MLTQRLWPCALFRIASVVCIVAVLGSAVAFSDPVVFKKSKFVVRKADGKRSLVRSNVVLHDDRVEVLDHGHGAVLKSIQYGDIKSAEYSFSKSPRWKSGAGAAAAVGVFAIPVFFMKGKKHWLTITEEGDYAVIKLDKRIFREVIAALEAKAGVEVERIADK